MLVEVKKKKNKWEGHERELDIERYYEISLAFLRTANRNSLMIFSAYY